MDTTALRPLIDDIYEKVKGLGMPRSSVEAVLKAYEAVRIASDPPMAEADLTKVLNLIASSRVELRLPGQGMGEIERLGTQAALGIITALQVDGIRFFLATAEPSPEG